MKNYILIIILFMITHSSWASLTEYESQANYKKASELCQEYASSDTLGTKVLTSLQASSHGAYVGAKKALSSGSLGVSGETSELIGSKEYFQALTECFGSYSEHRLKWDSMTLMLILSDSAAQAVVYVGVTTAAGKVLKLLGSLSQISKLRFLEGYFIDNPSAVKYLVRASAVIGGLVSADIGYEMYSQSRYILDGDYAKKEEIGKIKNEQMTELDKDYGSALGNLKSVITKLKNLPETPERNAKISKLEKVYTKTLADYQKHKNAYLALINK